MIPYLLFILIIGAVYHCLMETIIVPALRLRVLFKLSEMRDKLIRLRIDSPTEISKASFDHINNQMMLAINYAPAFNFVRLYRSKYLIKKHPEMLESIKKMNLEIEKLSAPAKNLYYKFCKDIFLLAIINASAWFIYLAPIIIPFLFIIGLCASILQRINECKVQVVNFYRSLTAIIFSDRNLEKKLNVQYIQDKRDQSSVFSVS